MKKELTLFQFLTIAITLLTLIIGAWINFTIKVSDLNARVVNLEQNAVKMDKIQHTKVDVSTFYEMSKNMNARLESIQRNQEKIYQILINRR